MIRGLTLWLIRHTCAVCGTVTLRRHFHAECERTLSGGAV